MQNTGSFDIAAIRDRAKNFKYGTENRRRKTPPKNVNLLQFVQAVWGIYNDTKNNSENKTMDVPPKLARYVSSLPDAEEPEAKRARVSPEPGAEPKNLKESVRQHLFREIIKDLIVELEAENVQFQFSREALKFFLCTYDRFLSIRDFQNTNLLEPGKNDKRGTKTTAQLSLGSILLEYCKYPDMLLSNINRSDKSDVEAIKLIYQHRIRLSPKMFQIIGDLRFESPVYEVERAADSPHPDYIKIPITNFKHQVILVTRDIMMVHDGYQFTIPAPNIEKDLTVTQLRECQLGKGEYVILDMDMAKNRIIDIVVLNKGQMTLPEAYFDRLRLAEKLLPKVKRIVDPEAIPNTPPGPDTHILYKALNGLGRPAYIYNKPNLTVAAIGINEHHVYLAYVDPSEKTMVIKTKATIAGAIAVTLLAHRYRPMSEAPSEPMTIRYNNEEYRIEGNVSEIHSIFETAIPIDLKENNKITNLSTKPVSSIHEYKPINSNKEEAIFDNFVSMMTSANIPKLIQQIVTSPYFSSDMMKLFTTSKETIPVDFGA